MIAFFCNDYRRLGDIGRLGVFCVMLLSTPTLTLPLPGRGTDSLAFEGEGWGEGQRLLINLRGVFNYHLEFDGRIQCEM